VRSRRRDDEAVGGIRVIPRQLGGVDRNAWRKLQQLESRIGSEGLVDPRAARTIESQLSQLDFRGYFPDGDRGNANLLGLVDGAPRLLFDPFRFADEPNPACVSCVTLENISVSAANAPFSVEAKPLSRRRHLSPLADES
jgi:hypothetical protein